MRIEHHDVVVEAVGQLGGSVVVRRWQAGKLTWERVVDVAASWGDAPATAGGYPRALAFDKSDNVVLRAFSSAGQVERPPCEIGLGRLDGEVRWNQRTVEPGTLAANGAVMLGDHYHDFPIYEETAHELRLREIRHFSDQSLSVDARRLGFTEDASEFWDRGEDFSSRTYDMTIAKNDPRLRGKWQGWATLRGHWVRVAGSVGDHVLLIAADGLGRELGFALPVRNDESTFPVWFHWAHRSELTTG